MIVLHVRLIRISEEFHIIIDYSPAQVREDFQSVDNPFAIYARTLADDDSIESNENGATYKMTRLFGWYTSRVRYEVEKLSDGGLLLRSWKNGSESTATSISIEPSSSTGSRVTVDSGRSEKITLLMLFVLWLRRTHITSALEAYGYEIVGGGIHNSGRKFVRSFAVRARSDKPSHSLRSWETPNREASPTNGVSRTARQLADGEYCYNSYVRQYQVGLL